MNQLETNQRDSPCDSVSHGRYNMDVEVASDLRHESLTPMYDAMQDRIASLRSLMAVPSPRVITNDVWKSYVSGPITYLCARRS
jgi:hypothetical protein